MTKRYPAVEPYEVGTLEVGDAHTLYYEVVGNPSGTPAVFLHGGPGSSCTPGARRNFDPDAYRAVFFDQRGCGRSRPSASDPDTDLSTNTTDHLIADMEQLREHPEAERSGDLSAAYARLLADPDPEVHERAAQGWCWWEDTHVSLMPGWEPSPRYEDPAFRLVFARLVTHYWRHGCFLADGEVLAGAHRLVGIPAVLIHGRWDVSGPLDTAWALHRAWSGSQLIVLEDAGHGGAGFPEAMTAALEGFRGLS